MADCGMQQTTPLMQQQIPLMYHKISFDPTRDSLKKKRTCGELEAKALQAVRQPSGHIQGRPVDACCRTSHDLHSDRASAARAHTSGFNASPAHMRLHVTLQAQCTPAIATVNMACCQADFDLLFMNDQTPTLCLSCTGPLSWSCARAICMPILPWHQVVGACLSLPLHPLS